jgi:hypothetical protein
MKRPLPPLTAALILRWADTHRRQAGTWPRRDSGPVPGVADLTWCAVHMALAQGHRGLPGGDTLARLLARHRGAQTKPALPRLSAKEILSWADEHHRRTNQWPTTKSGLVAGQGVLTWGAVNRALARGQRGLTGGTSLARLLADCRGVRSPRTAPRLTEELILGWARAHQRRTGRRPGARSGPIPEAPGETWGAVYQALYEGLRGLPGGYTLTRLLCEQRPIGQR